MTANHDVEGWKLTTEDIMGDFGFRLCWEASDYWMNVHVFEITARDGKDDRPMFPKMGAQSRPDDVYSHEEAEPYLTGFVKWDGCSEFDIGQPHWCGASDYVKHCALLKHIYHRAFELMGREPEELWEEAK